MRSGALPVPDLPSPPHPRYPNLTGAQTANLATRYPTHRKQRGGVLDMSDAKKPSSRTNGPGSRSCTVSLISLSYLVFAEIMSSIRFDSLTSFSADEDNFAAKAGTPSL